MPLNSEFTSLFIGIISNKKKINKGKRKATKENKLYTKFTKSIIFGRRNGRKNWFRYKL